MIGRFLAMHPVCDVARVGAAQQKSDVLLRRHFTPVFGSA